MYTIHDIAILLRVNTRTVRMWALAGKLHGTRGGRDSWQFTQTDLDTFLQSHSVRHWDKTPEQRFWAMVEKSDLPNACWLWTGHKTKDGYGKLYMQSFGYQIYTHRISYMLAYGSIPIGFHVLHRCDNPPCCNPSHLFLGTQQDNMRDREAKGRWRVDLLDPKNCASCGKEFIPRCTHQIYCKKGCRKPLSP